THTHTHTRTNSYTHSLTHLCSLINECLNIMTSAKSDVIKSRHTQTVTIEDTTPPVLSGQGSDVTIECPATAAFTDPTVSDACDPNVTISSSDVINLDACGLGTVTRTWT